MAAVQSVLFNLAMIQKFTKENYQHNSSRDQQTECARAWHVQKNDWRIIPLVVHAFCLTVFDWPVLLHCGEFWKNNEKFN